MVGSATSIVVTVAQAQTLTSWPRGATTRQSLARRARIALGSAAGLGSRRLAQLERMIRVTVQR